MWEKRKSVAFPAGMMDTTETMMLHDCPIICLNPVYLWCDVGDEY